MLNHLVFVTWDHKAYNRCLELHPHCYQMETKDDEEDYGSDELFMSTKYVHMMWRRTEFLNSVVQTGYSFVFTVCFLLLCIYIIIARIYIPVN